MAIRIDPQAKPIRLLTPDGRQRLGRLTVSYDSYMASVIQDDPEHAMCWRAAIENRVVAWSLLRWFTPDIRAPHNAYVSVFVSAEVRKRGVGRLLVRSAVDYAQEHQLRPCFYGTTSGQINFYLACGVSKASITPDAFPRTYWEHARFVKNGLRLRR